MPRRVKKRAITCFSFAYFFSSFPLFHHLMFHESVFAGDAKVRRKHGRKRDATQLASNGSIPTRAPLSSHAIVHVWYHLSRPRDWMQFGGATVPVSRFVEHVESVPSVENQHMFILGSSSRVVCIFLGQKNFVEVVSATPWSTQDPRQALAHVSRHGSAFVLLCLLSMITACQRHHCGSIVSSCARFMSTCATLRRQDGCHSVHQ